jgi:hypothetical protein
MLHKDHTAAMGNSMANPYSRAYHRDLVTTGLAAGGNGCGRAPDPASYRHSVAQVWYRTPHQQQRLLRAKQHASVQTKP